MLRRAIQGFPMKNVATSPATSNNTEAELWQKTAKAFQTRAGIAGTGGDTRTGTPKEGDIPGNMLKSAYALQTLV